MFRIVVLFLPSLLDILWQNDPAISMVWSLAGSYFIAAIALSPWFRQSDGTVPFKNRLLHPSFTFHFYFIGLHVVGGGFYFLENLGFSNWQWVGVPSEFELALTAKAQGLMLLAHASVTAGMKLAGSGSKRRWYYIPYIPPYRLIILSLTCLIVASIANLFAGFQNLGYKLMQISSLAVILEITFAIVQREYKNIGASLVLLLLNLLSLSLSGWKSPILWLMLALCAMLYPLMPRRVCFIGCAFGLFWLLYFYPFVMVLRPLIWRSQTDQKTAIAISVEATLRMSFEERANYIWYVMGDRANELYQFKKYLEYVPANHPYFGLDLAEQSLIGLVPRVIWPEKPELEPIAMQRVYDAGIVSETTDVSAKSNLYQDAYLSGDWPAVIPVSLIFGFIFILLNRFAERLFGGYEIGTCLIFTSLFGDPFRYASDFLYLVGATWSSFLVMLALFFLGRATGWIVPVSLHPPAER